MLNANQSDATPSEMKLTDHALLSRFRGGEDDAATQLYLKYAARLRCWASAQTSSAFATRFDEDDVVQSVFRTLFRRVSGGLYDVPPGEELWQLLLVITLNKIRKLVSRHRAKKRDVHKTQGSHVLENVDADAASDSTALRFLELVIDELLGALPEVHREIVEMRIAGHDIAQIATRTNRSLRTVERVLQNFRATLSTSIDLTA